MKKYFILVFIALSFSNHIFSQSNIGFIAGGGVSYANVKSLSISGIDTPDSAFGGITNFLPMYHVGINFENVLIERLLYLQFGVHALNKGFNIEDKHYLNAHGIHIPLEIKYKYFFNRRGENYVSANLGSYASAYYKGIEYNKADIDVFLADTTGVLVMNDPRIQFGKLIIDEYAEMSTFDYGISAGLGIGLFGHLQLNYNFGLSASYYKYVPQDYGLFYYRNRFHTITLGYFFTNE